MEITITIKADERLLRAIENLAKFLDMQSEPNQKEAELPKPEYPDTPIRLTADTPAETEEKYMDFSEFQAKVIETCDARTEGKKWVAKCLSDMGVTKLSDLKPEHRAGFLEVIRNAN